MGAGRESLLTLYRGTHLKRSQRVSSRMAITTPARVRNRIQAAEADIPDEVLNEFIADEQAFAEAYAGRPSRNPIWNSGSRARSICTKGSLRSQNLALHSSAFRRRHVLDRGDETSSKSIRLIDPLNANLLLAKSLWTHACGKRSWR
jgi:hypothetical protein